MDVKKIEEELIEILNGMDITALTSEPYDILLLFRKAIKQVVESVPTKLPKLKYKSVTGRFYQRQWDITNKFEEIKRWKKKILKQLKVKN